MNNLQQELALIAKFPKVKICCIGDLILDRYQEGKVARVSPEAPVVVMVSQNTREVLGGAANVAANLADLGCKVTLCGVVGTAKEDSLFQALLAKQRISANLVSAPNFVVPVKTRLIAGSQQLLRLDKESTPQQLTKSSWQQALKKWEPSIKASQLMVISDYAKGTLPKELTKALIRLAKKLHLPVLVDPKGSDYQKYAGATLLKPNLKEFNEATRHLTKRNLALHQADFWPQFSRLAKKLLKELKLDSLIVTLSEHGMAYLDTSTKEPLRANSVAKSVFDVSGAGDTVIATLAIALALKAPILQAMELANLAASIVVEKLGTATVSQGELKKKLTEQLSLLKVSQEEGAQSCVNVINFEAKIVSMAKMQVKLKALRQEGLTIGFTNGCFDCLHLGHLNSLKEARSHCDYLIVGLNSDLSVKRLKGPGRPLQDQKTRAVLLASLSFVDAVVIFNEPSALKLVSKLRPDVIAKQGYKLGANWPEAKLVASYGGKVLELSKVRGYATTDWLAKVIRKQQTAKAKNLQRPKGPKRQARLTKKY